MYLRHGLVLWLKSMRRIRCVIAIWRRMVMTTIITTMIIMTTAIIITTMTTDSMEMIYQALLIIYASLSVEQM